MKRGYGHGYGTRHLKKDGRWNMTIQQCKYAYINACDILNASQNSLIHVFKVNLKYRF